MPSSPSSSPVATTSSWGMMTGLSTERPVVTSEERSADETAATDGAAGETSGEATTAFSSSLGSDTLPPGDASPTQPIKVYVAGDSTVATYRDTASTTDQAGWGQMLHEYLADLAQVENKAVGGTTSRSFIDSGYLEEIAAGISPGDSLLVQFGTNDGNKTATYDLNGQQVPYYLEPGTDFKTYLAKYIDLATAKGVNLIFVTPPPRNSAYCTGGNGTGGHAEAMRELAASRGVPLADLNERSVAYLTAICPAPTPEDFFLVRADGSVDGTHFQENGARILAGLVADEISRSAAPLRPYVKARP